MIHNVIELQFDKCTTRLAGNPYGKTVFKQQVEEKIKYDCQNIITFPDAIEKVASSFVQGFFAEVIERVGYSGFDDVVIIKAGNRELEKNIHEDLFV